MNECVCVEKCKFFHLLLTHLVEMSASNARNKKIHRVFVLSLSFLFKEVNFFGRHGENIALAAGKKVFIRRYIVFAWFPFHVWEMEEKRPTTQLKMNNKHLFFIHKIETNTKKPQSILNIYIKNKCHINWSSKISFETIEYYTWFFSILFSFRFLLLSLLSFFFT